MRALVLFSAPLLFAAGMRAAVSSEANQELESVIVTGWHYDTKVGSSDAASEGVISAALVESRAVLRPGEVLEFVPGLIVTQHSGDGKANQYFLRGFNLDHGTDFATSIEGMPVNMPSHGHGQGYSDVNFLIPELIERIEYRKGPYFARSGDFASAGSADIEYKRSLDAPFATLTLGERGYRRAVLGASGMVNSDVSALGTVELQRNDGPWKLPEDLSKSNGVFALGGTSWRATAMAYDAHWDSTDQIPQRLIDAGTYLGQPFGRFDAVDKSDGGSTQRYSLSGQWDPGEGNLGPRVSAYAMDYQLRLFSNFTYALDRPVDGDQFSQQDRRRVYGAQASQMFALGGGDAPPTLEVGAQVRHDSIRVGLFETRQRVITATTREDLIHETLGGVYAQLSAHPAEWLRTVVGLRADAARFDVDSLHLAANSGKADDNMLSPKLSMIFGPWERTELFVNAGRGFHSNDARGTTATVDPNSGDPVDSVPGLVKSRGFELGARSEWLPGLQSSVALWTLDFASELVYVGDAGTTEPNRPSRRRGIEWNNHYTGVDWLLVDVDLAWTHARFKGNDPDGDYIPNSVDRVASAGFTVPGIGGWSVGLQWRYLGKGPLIEDNSERAQDALTANARLSRKFGRHGHVTLEVFNLLDSHVNDIQYFYESRLPGEAVAVDDRHVHPGEPRTFRLSASLRF